MQRLAVMQEPERLRLAEFIVTRCFLVVVSTPDLESAYRIFSVLNSRGLDLSATDILKADILGAFPADKREAYTEKWEDAEEQTGREAFTELFAHIRMIYRKKKPESTLIREFREHVSEIRDPAYFIDGILTPITQAFMAVSKGAYESASGAEAVNAHFGWLNRLEFTDWMPPALAFFARNKPNCQLMAVFFKDLERLAYAMLVRQSGANERIERFSRLTMAIESGLPLENVDSPLQLTQAEKQEFSDKLNGSIYDIFNARARTTLLLKLDSLLTTGGATYDRKITTVEHVLPQNPPPGSAWLAAFPNSERRAYWTHRLGNLVLLPRNKNSAASNKDFIEKKKTYFTGKGVVPFVITIDVLNSDQWTPASVERRQNNLLKLLIQYWRLEWPPVACS